MRWSASLGGAGRCPREEPSTAPITSRRRLDDPQDRLAGKIASYQPDSRLTDRAPIPVDRHQRAKPPIGQQLEQAGEPLARPLDLDIAREIEPLDPALARQHELADRPGRFLANAPALHHAP